MVLFVLISWDMFYLIVMNLPTLHYLNIYYSIRGRSSENTSNENTFITVSSFFFGLGFGSELVRIGTVRNRARNWFSESRDGSFRATIDNFQIGASQIWFLEKSNFEKKLWSSCLKSKITPTQRFELRRRKLSLLELVRN